MIRFQVTHINIDILKKIFRLKITTFTALTPAHFNQDESEEQEEEEEEHVDTSAYGPVTPIPPVRSTTLRTIIKPDSEVYHSNRYFLNL